MCKKVKLCLVSAVQTSFWGSGKREYEKRDLPGIRALAKEFDFELAAIEQPITNETEAVRARAEIERLNADFLMIQVSTFAAGEILLPLAQTGLRMGLWGVPEVAENGAIPNNSFCGVNMYASILQQYLGAQARYKWFYGNLNGRTFRERLRVTVRALQAIKTLNGAKVALVGGIAPGFHDFCFDERLAREKLGVRIDRLVEYADIRDRALAYPKGEIAGAVEKMKQEYVGLSKDMDQPHLENSARVYRAFQDLVEENGYDAIAISCWPKYRRDLGIVVCSVIGRLLDHGLVAACEGDVDSAVTMLLLRELTGERPMLMDLSKVDERDNTLLMWHCGSAPSWYADRAGVTLEGHYKPGRHVTCGDDERVVGVNNMYYGSRAVTVARLTNNYRNMLLFSGEFVEKSDHGYHGSRGWMGKLHSDGRPLASGTLSNTVLSQGFQHHYPIAAGNVEPELREVMAWLGIAPVEWLEYRDYMQPSTLR